MLDTHTINIIKSTVPFLKKNSEILTHHFYEKMFTNNPEVMQFFNQSNQINGNQQKVLAAAITGYASNIDKLEALDEIITLISNKHASLNIKPEHYPIVGENLLAAIRDVLKDNANDEIIEAWGKAYWFLANILINKEQLLYKYSGWEGFRNFKVMHKKKESDVITSFYLVSENGETLPMYKSGQYITIRVPSSNGDTTTMRNYSLSDIPGKTYFRISVKREVDLQANIKGYVSNKLHDTVHEGDIIESRPPFGNFFLKENNEEKVLVLLSGGVGITPIISMLLQSIKINSKRKIIFIHACINKKVQAFKSTIDSLEEKFPNLTVYYIYSNPDEEDILQRKNEYKGFINEDLLNKFIPIRKAEYYFCGPKIFMINIYKILKKWNIDNSDINFEFFGPRTELENLN